MKKRVLGLGLTIITAVIMFVLAMATLIVPVSVNAETVSAENSTSSQTATVAEVGQSTEVSSPSGTLGTGVALDEAEGSYIYFDLTNLNAKNSIVIKLYSGSTLLANTNLKKTEYLAYSALSAKVCITTTSSSWETEWLEDKIYNLVPDSAELYVDNVKVSTTNTINMYNTDRPQEAREWFEVDGVTPLVKVSNNGAVTKFGSLNKAFENAKAGDVIDLLFDTTITEEIRIKDNAVLANITFNGNGNTIFADLNKDNQSVLYFGDTATSAWATGVKIYNLNINATARFGIALMGGTSSILENIDIIGDYVYAINLYGTHGATMTNCNVVSMFTNGSDDYPLNLVNTKVNTLYANKSDIKEGAKVFIDSNSSVDTLYFWGDTTVMIDGSSIDKITNIEAKSGKISAKVNNMYYVKLQDAINDAQDGDVIKLLSDSNEDVTIVQKENLDIVLDGNGKTYSGTITIHGQARYQGEETLIIKNVNFVTDEAEHYFIDSNSTASAERYAHNVTVENCSFTATGAGEKSAAAMRIRQGFNIKVVDCNSNGLHSVLQGYGIAGVNVDKLTITSGKNAISLGTSTNAVISNSSINVDGYGIRADGTGEYGMTLEGNNISANLPVVVRNATGKYTVTVNNGNTFNAGNDNGYAITFTSGDDGTYQTPTGDVELNGSGADSLEIYGIAAKIKGVNYTTLQEAIDSANNGDVITLMSDLSEDVIILQKENVNLVLDGNGNTYSGTIKIDGDARYYATETLTIKNFKFVTAESTHDFIAANASYSGKNYNYAHNVTITKCSFDYVGTETTNAVVAMRIRQGHGIIVENVTANNIHSLIQGYGIESVKFDTVTINNAKEGGISLGTSFDVTINKAYVSGAQYGIRADGNADNSDTDLSVTNSEFNAQFPVVVRSATGNYSLIVENNTYNASNTNGYAIVFTKGAVGTFQTPTGDVKLVGNISDSAVFGVVVKVNDTNYFQNIEDAVAYANENGGTITLLNNIELVGKSLNIASDKAIKLDLNGYDLVGTPTEQKAYAVIINNGNLTITGNGEICCNHNLAGSTGYAVNTILNAGTLVIDGAIIINTSTASNQIGYAIDNNSTSNNAILTINDGIISASGSNYYDGIRLFANSITNENSVTVKGGTISSIWLQNPSDGSGTENTKDVKGSVTVEGGEVNNLYLEPSLNFTASITGGNIGSVSYFQTSENRNLVRFISGGTFGSAIDEPFWAAGYVVISQGNVYVTITMAEFAEIVADEIREEVEIRLTQKAYSVAGENSFENIVLEAIDRIGQLDYVSEINRVMLWVNEAFDKVLTEYECQELIIEYAIKAKDYAELKKVDFNDQRIIDAFAEMSNYALKLEMQLVFANVYDVIDTIAQENALALQNAKDNAILELMGANGENANNVTSSMIASINVCNTIEQVESSLVVAKAELTEIITYKAYIKNASEKANELATTLNDVSSKLATIESTLNTKFQGLSDMINNANSVIDQIKSSTDSIIANAATKAELQTKLDEINTAISKVTSDVIAYVKDNVLTEISKLSEEITKISEKAQQAAEKALEAANSVKDLPATLTSVNTAVAEAKEAAAKATEEATKIANLVDSLNQNITNGTNSIDAAKLASDKAAQAAEQAAQAAVKAEEAAKIAAEKAQTTEVKAHAAVSETELKTWLEDYLGELQAAIAQPMSLYAASTIPATDTFRDELIEKLAVTYSKENADLILSYYDQAIAQINASTSKEEINYALAIFKSNVSLVDSLVTLAPTPAYNDSSLVTLLKVVIIVEGVIVIITLIALILVIKARKGSGNGGDTPKNSIAVEETSAVESEETAISTQAEDARDGEDDEEVGAKLQINGGEFKTFEERLSTAEPIVKQGYQTIRESLLSYKKVNERISKKAVSYRNGRKLLCKMTIVGKTLRAYLALDPNAYEVSKYFQKDVSGIKAYEEVPMLMRVRSGRAIKRVCNLITELEKANELIKKPEPKQ